MGLHRCTEPECPYTGKPSPRSCGCNLSDETMLREQRDEAVALLKELVDIEGPCPGTGAWARKVHTFITKATGEPT